MTHHHFNVRAYETKQNRVKYNSWYNGQLDSTKNTLAVIKTGNTTEREYSVEPVASEEKIPNVKRRDLSENSRPDNNTMFRQTKRKS